MTTLDIEQTREAWDRIACGYDEHVTPSHLWLGEQAVSRAGVSAGTRFLDVASGSGALSIPAARRGASVLAVDLSPSMLASLERRARDESLADVQTRVMDGHALELDDATFDVTGSQFGVMLFPDLPRAVREMARVTRRGGRVLLVVYGPPTQVEFIELFLGAIQSVESGFQGLPVDPPPLPFQVSEVGKLRAALADAGLRDIEIETTTERLTFASGTDMWNWLLNSNPLAGILVGDLSDEQRNRVRERLGELLRLRSGAGGPAVLTNPVHIAIGSP